MYPPKHPSVGKWVKQILTYMNNRVLFHPKGKNISVIYNNMGGTSQDCAKVK